jgi:ornithine carbamoyltransferase
VLTHLRSLADLAPADFSRLLSTAAEMKAARGAIAPALAGRSAILLFEKDSLRTRCSFEVGVHRLGGHAMYMDHSKSRIGARESVADYARNLDRYFGLIIARVYDHRTVQGLAEHASVPVINALCDRHHPCQALADFLTIGERLGDLRRVRLAYVGEPNNVSNSLLHAAALSGATMTLVAPPGCGIDAQIRREAETIARTTAATLRFSEDPQALRDHDVVYTDTWFSMGFPSDDSQATADLRASRLALFAPYRVTAAMMSRAGASSLFMHCLPAGRGVEVTDEVMDGPHSVIFDQAENRMWAQMALMAELIRGSAIPAS